MTKQNEQLITLINRLCAVEEHAWEVVRKLRSQVLPAEQSIAIQWLEKALNEVSRVREGTDGS